VEFTFELFGEFPSHSICFVDSEIAIDLLIAAKMVGLERLRGMVESVVGYAIDVENAACIYDVAKLYSCGRLQKACEYFIFGNYSAIVGTDAWNEMDAENRDHLVAQAKTLGVI